jgi:flagellar motor switch protein FliG
MLKVTFISGEMQVEVLREFSFLAVEVTTGVYGGLNQVQNLLDKSVGLLRASDIIGRVSPVRAPVAAMQQIVETEPRQLFNLIRHEHIQTIALVVSYLPNDKASQLLSFMRPEMRDEVIERLATLAPTSIEVVEQVAAAIQTKMGANRSRNLTQTGGLKVAAQVLNALPKDVSKAVLMSLSERKADLAEAISKKMFTFEELETLDPQSLQKIMQTIDFQALALALKTSSESLKNKLLACLPKRAAENIREEISFMGPRKLSQIDAARASIIETVKNLDAEGEIELDAGKQAATA